MQAIEDGLQDLYVFPILFLYRHHLELQLKLIIKSANLLLSSDSEAVHGHILKKLWREASDLIGRVWPNGDTSYLHPVDELIKELISIDPDSTAFRYANDKKGNKHLESVSYVNIRILKELMAVVVEILIIA